MITELRGGKFKSGFVGAFIAKLSPASSWVQQGLFNLPIRTVAAAVFGGLAAKATGGSFRDGAMAAAFAHLFNAESGQVYDRNDPNYHDYTVGPTDLCTIDEAGCSIANMTQIAEQYSVPDLGIILSGDAPPVGYISLAPLPGTDTRNPIYHDRGFNWSLNVTLEGHRYYPGQVLHVVNAVEGVVSLTSYGTGIGSNGAENYFTGYGLFGSSHVATYWDARAFITGQKLGGMFK